MQSVIQQIQEALAGNVGLAIGYVLIGLVVMQSLLLVMSSSRRVVYERRQRKLDQERLRYQVKAAAIQFQEAEQIKLYWNGYRKFQVAKKVLECEDVYSFYLEPHDRKKLPAFKPGQYLTFSLDIPGRDKPVIRCYSLSDSSNPAYYRVTIKRATPPPDCKEAPCGVASGFFSDHVKEGDILDVKAPSGNFFLDLNKQIPIVLISGGVGITPMISMMNAVIQSGTKREVWFFFGARNRCEHIQKDYLEKVATEHANVRMNICYSRPGKEDVVGKDYHHSERVSVELFKRLLPSNNFEYYICGPGPMMKSVTDGLREWGVPDGAVFYEAFGPATVKKAAPVQVAEASKTTLKINFSRSGKECLWDPQSASLLDFAEAHGVKVEAGCRAGNCGTCLVAIKSGEIGYISEHGALGEEGSCLTCICKPKTDLVLDA